MIVSSFCFALKSVLITVRRYSTGVCGHRACKLPLPGRSWSTWRRLSRSSHHLASLLVTWNPLSPISLFITREQVASTSSSSQPPTSTEHRTHSSRINHIQIGSSVLLSVRADRPLPSLDATALRPTTTVSTATPFMACHRVLA
jgi:hypothetical protein